MYKSIRSTVAKNYSTESTQPELYKDIHKGEYWTEVELLGLLRRI